VARAQRIDFDDDGAELIDLKSGKPAWRFQWSDVVEIATWKHDAWFVDFICLGFRVGGRVFICHDENFHWPELCEYVTRRFNLDPLWIGIVAQPAFATNLRSLWGEPSPPEPEPDETLLQRIGTAIRHRFLSKAD
jgi:hypothetical protein